jgi:hypothetical protein
MAMTTFDPKTGKPLFGYEELHGQFRSDVPKPTMPSLGQVLEEASGKLAALHKAINELEQRASLFCRPGALTEACQSASKVVGLSPLRSSIIDINESVTDATLRIEALIEAIDN